jgi:hypothetical protein
MFPSIFKNAFTLCLLCFTFQSQSQTYSGLRGGVNIAHVTHSKDGGGGVSNRKITGAVAGLYFDFGVKDNMAIRTELNFIQKGFIRETPFGDRIYRLNYFDLATLFKYRFVNFNNSPKTRKQLHVYLLAGPFLGYSGSGKIIAVEDGEKWPYDFGGGVSLSHADVGMVCAGGIEIPLGKGHLVTDIRYNLGLLPLTNEQSPNGVIKNHGIIFSAGYALRLKK